MANREEVETLKRKLVDKQDEVKHCMALSDCLSSHLAKRSEGLHWCNS